MGDKFAVCQDHECQIEFLWSALYFKLNAGVWILLYLMYAAHDKEAWKI